MRRGKERYHSLLDTQTSTDQSRRMGSAVRARARRQPAVHSAAGAGLKFQRGAAPSARTPAFTNGSCAPIRDICATRFLRAIAAFARMRRRHDRVTARHAEARLRGATPVSQTWKIREGSRKSLWDADHLVPVAEGGGQCDLSNMRTLCLLCHREATAALT